jgi:hypothetical protein
MMQFFEQLPTWLIVFIFLVLSFAVSNLIIFVIQRAFTIHHGSELSIVVKSLITFRLTGTASLILGFAIVTSTSSYLASVQNLAEEAFHIARLNDEIEILGQKSTAEIRPALKKYVRDIITLEWPEMRKSPHGEQETQSSLKELSRSIIRAKSVSIDRDADFNDINTAKGQMEVMRLKRLTYANQTIPTVFWGLAGIFFIAINALGALLEMDNIHHNRLYVNTCSVVVGLLASILFIVSHPFTGDVSVNPAPLERVLAVLSAEG